MDGWLHVELRPTLIKYVMEIAYQRCPGIGNEEPVKGNLIFIQAFSITSIYQTTFKLYISIDEPWPLKAKAS